MPAYNNFYPATYQSPIQAQYPQQYSQQSVPQQMQYPQTQVMPQQASTGITWVSGEIGARAYPSPAPGQSILLMDSEDKRFYIRGTDTNGMPLPLRTFSYTEEVSTQHSYDAPQHIDTSQFITRDELEQMLNERLPVQASTAMRGKSNESAI